MWIHVHQNEKQPDIQYNIHETLAFNMSRHGDSLQIVFEFYAYHVNHVLRLHNLI